MRSFAMKMFWNGVMACWCGLALAVGAAPGATPDTAERGETGNGTVIVSQGVSVEFGLVSGRDDKPGSASVFERDAAMLQLKIADAATGVALPGLRPAVWLDRRRDASVTCKEKINAFLQGTLAYRPDVDLARYYILTLNDDPSVSVIDPLLGLGTTKLVSRIELQSPGADWALDKEGKRLYIAMPLAGRIAVIDMSSWKQVASAGPLVGPVRIALQPDQNYLWVQSNGTADGVGSSITAIDTRTLEIAASIPFGAGDAGFAFTDDSRYAFATSRAGVLGVIDVRELKLSKEITVNAAPAALAYSPLSKALYVASEGRDEILVLDGQKLQIRAMIPTPSGLFAIRFAPNGRWGFALDRKGRRVHVLDASTNQMMTSVALGGTPAELSFTSSFAYVRVEESEQVTMIGLDAIGGAGALPVSSFPGGQRPPGATRLPAATSIAPSPEGAAVLLANALDQTIYYYAEGMAAPMGSFQNYGHQPRSILVLDRSVRETRPGIYSARFEAPPSGTYDVAVLLDSPRIYHCYTANFETDPLRRATTSSAGRVEYLAKERVLRVGEATRVRFRLTGSTPGRPNAGATDVRVLAMLAPGVWQRREKAESIGDGIYEVKISAPRAGVYYLYVESPSLGLRFNEQPYVIMQGTRAATGG